MKKKKNFPLIENVEIRDIGAEGKAIAKIDNMVIFVPGCIPGDIVDIQITNKRRRFISGRAIKFHQYSPLRTTPFCLHFGICGGCKWQHLAYHEQLKYKQQQVIDQLERIGKVPLPACQPIMPSPTLQFYRNKLEFTFSSRRWLTPEEMQQESLLNKNGVGFHIEGQFDKVLDIYKCYLQPDPSNDIRNSIREFALKNNISFFNLRMQEGFLRTLIIKTTTTGETMVIIVFYYNDDSLRNQIFDFLTTKFPQVNSWCYVINNKGNDSIFDQEVILYKGKNYLIEQLEDLKFKTGAKSFFQVNTHQALRMYQKIRELSGLTGTETVYDLYTGTGTIALFIAKLANNVIGIEYIEEAIQYAKENARLNNISNCQFFTGTIEDILTPEFIKQNGKPDLVITDPPRAGMHEKVIQQLITILPRRIIYVSCNPATQARDINLLSSHYSVSHIQPADMFPHTFHVENIVVLNKK